METEGPALLNQQTNHLGKVLLHGRHQVRPRFEKVLEVGRGECQHFTGAVHAVEIIALARRGHLRPFAEVPEFFLGMLGE